MRAKQDVRILVVEAELRLRKVRAELLEKAGYDVYPAANLEDAITRCKPDAYDVVVLRANSRSEANRVCEKVRQVNPQQLIVVVEHFNDYSNLDCADEIVDAHDPGGLLDTLANALSGSRNLRRVQPHESDEPNSDST